MNAKLQEVIDNVELVRLLSDKDIVVSVMDSDGIVRGLSMPPSIPPTVEIGDRFEDPTGAFDEVIRTGEMKHNILPKEVVGMAMEGNLVPIKDGTTVVGCVISTYSVEEKERIREIATQFQQSVGEVNKSLQDIVGGLENLLGMLTEMNRMTSDIEKDVNGAAGVVNKVSGNASHSNILALNASIEAARSGVTGRGFAVVATEMGKLAHESGKSATEIKTILTAVAKHSDLIVASIKEANGAAKGYMDGINDIKETLERIIALADQLKL